MNGIYGMALVYESLIPVNNVEDTFLSVGTVTMQDSEGELNLDFNETCSSCERAKDGIVTFTTSLRCFEPGTFLEEYLAASLSPSDLTYDFSLPDSMIPILRKFTQNTSIARMKPLYR